MYPNDCCVGHISISYLCPLSTELRERDVCICAK